MQNGATQYNYDSTPLTGYGIAPGAWSHIVVAIDTNQATATNRVKMYLNGTALSVSNSTAIPRFTNLPAFNLAYPHYIGAYLASSAYSDMYLAEVNFVNNQQLLPTAFGKTDPATGVWSPIAYAGTYGTNGFYLKFSNPAGLGTDYSGLSNSWTPNNFSTTAGPTYDSMIDSPTRYYDGTGYNVGNYATLNPNPIEQSYFYVKNGNLSFTTYSDATYIAATRCVGSTMQVSSGKWYWEVTVTSLDATAGALIGVGKTNVFAVGLPSVYKTTDFIWYRNDGQLVYGTASSFGASYTTGDIIGAALDLDSGTLSFYKNGTLQGTFSGIPAGFYVPMLAPNTAASTSTTFSINYGQSAFNYSIPSGCSTLNTFNLPVYAFTTSGTFTGVANYPGPFIYTNGYPLTVVINGNTVPAGNVSRTAMGFQVNAKNQALYNAVGTNTWSVTQATNFKYSLAQSTY